MEDNSRISPPKLSDRLRSWTRTFASSIFTAPFLPIILTTFFITTVVTHLAMVLMSQPLSYWTDPSNAVGYGIFGEKLVLSAGGLITLAVVYVIIATLLLFFVNYRWSLIGWFIAEFVHFYLIQDVLSSCYFSRWSVQLGRLCQIIDYGTFWALVAVIIGVLLVFNFQPAGFSLQNKKFEKGISYASIFAPAVWGVLMIVGVILSVQKPNSGWIPVEVKNGPRPTGEAEAAYDTSRNRLVMYGGVAGYLGDNEWNYITDTWEWDGNQWIKLEPHEHPQGRSDFAMAFDEERDVTVLFGGVNNGMRLSDTWEWDGQSWKRMNSYSDPSARSGHEMIYDAIRKKVVIYGGYDGEIFNNDAWEWDGRGWKRIELESDTPVASVFALAYEPNQNYALGFLSGPGGTWRWDEHKWTRLYPDVEPSNRGWSTIIYDASRNNFFIFGGISSGIMLDDTWIFNGQEWKEYTIRGVKPSARADMVLWYDPIREHVMLFGGYDNEKYYNDTWEFIPPGE